MLRFSLFASAAVTPFLLSPALAQDTFDLGTIVFSSNLSPVEQGRTGATVEVLEGVDAGTQDSSVITRLTRLPGISSTANGGLGAQANIAIRGLSSRYVGVRINGIDVTDPSTTQTSFNFGGLIGAGVDRIEVLKGSQSALYGSEAIGGVVNISTFRPTEMGFSGQYNVEAGSFDTQSASFGIGQKSERGEIALTYSRIKTDGISAQASNDEKDGFRQTTVTLSGEFEATDTATVGASIFYRDRFLEFDSFSNLFEINRTQERGARVYTTLETGAVTHTFSYTQFDIDRQTGGGALTTIEGSRREVAYLGSADLGNGMTLNFGVDRTDENLDSNTTVASEDTTSIKAELLASLENNVDLSAALRYDDNSDFGGKATGRLAAVWRPREDLAIRA
ncbi:TonB-dependent receptor plug domain-containing protein, partial [uncultured Sulfitobacter sp.]|uniref:TonB-dependent receptor n=1 Tax=uncultured Sulfitobacter sp. TaxID=191468 RepID=UPI0026140BD1